jgi:hypothetical protein
VRGTGPLAIDHLVEVVGRRNVGRFHSSLARAVSRTARPCLCFERLVRVLLVSELDHRLILLEPFQSAHKGQFCLIGSFHG